MRLKQYAEQFNITYQTAWSHWKHGYLNGYQLPNNVVIVDDVNPVKIKLDKRER